MAEPRARRAYVHFALETAHEPAVNLLAEDWISDSKPFVNSKRLPPRYDLATVTAVNTGFVTFRFGVLIGSPIGCTHSDLLILDEKGFKVMKSIKPFGWKYRACMILKRFCRKKLR